MIFIFSCFQTANPIKEVVACFASCYKLKNKTQLNKIIMVI